jgi:hypothetical protein
MLNNTASAKALVISTIMIAPMASLAQTAPTIDGTVSVSTTATQFDGSNFRLYAFNVVTDINFSEKFSIGFDLDQGRQSFDNGPTLNMSRVQIEPTWTFENDAYLGAYLQTASTNFSFASVTIDNVGIFGGYNQERWSVEAYLGQSSTEFSLPDRLEVRNAGLTFVASPTEKLEFFGHYARAEIKNSGGAGDITLSAIGTEYDFGNGIMSYASAGTFEFNIAGDSKATHMAIGGGAQLSEIGLEAPGMLTVELAKTDYGFGVEQTQVTVGWVIGIGNGNVTPLNGIARIARGGIRGPFIGGIGAFGVAGGFAG